MHSDAITAQTQSVLEKIGKSDTAKEFYLAGGTALALHIGHRESIDLDFFSVAPFDSIFLKNSLATIGSLEVTYQDRETLTGVLDEVRISFFHYPYLLLFPTTEYHGIAIADICDIAVMKLDAISNRGSKKDFIDLYFLLERYSVQDLLDFFEKRYTGVLFNHMHLIKSMTFFDDADLEPMPRMIHSISWEDIKQTIREKMKKAVIRE